MAFHQLLREYINGGVTSWHPFQRFKDATAVCLGYSYLGGLQSGERLELVLPTYKGGHSEIVALRNHLLPIADDIQSVILHGSLGDGQLTGYSDVDALVILRNEVFLDPVRLNKVARRLSVARKFMCRFDPLQHHGWFVLSAQDLKSYPEAILPLESLSNASVLLGETQLRVFITPSDRTVFDVSARRMVRKLIHQLEDGWRPANAYQLKSLMSEFMMLPVLFLQALSGKGEKKCDSFKKAENYYPAEIWTIMNALSDARRNWKYTPNILSKLVLCNPHRFHHRLRKSWPSAIPHGIKPVINEKFYKDLLIFAKETEKLLEAIPG